MTAQAEPLGVEVSLDEIVENAVRYGLSHGTQAPTSRTLWLLKAGIYARRAGTALWYLRKVLVGGVLVALLVVAAAPTVQLVSQLLTDHPAETPAAPSSARPVSQEDAGATERLEVTGARRIKIPVTSGATSFQPTARDILIAFPAKVADVTLALSAATRTCVWQISKFTDTLVIAVGQISTFRFAPENGNLIRLVFGSALHNAESCAFSLMNMVTQTASPQKYPPKTVPPAPAAEPLPSGVPSISDPGTAEDDAAKPASTPTPDNSGLACVPVVGSLLAPLAGDCTSTQAATPVPTSE